MVNLDTLQKVNLTHFCKQLKLEKVQTLMKYLLKYETQGNLMTYFFDYATLCVTKAQ